MFDAKIGELIVGAYLKKVVGCEMVTYNQRSMEKGEQGEIDVLGIDTSQDSKEVFICEVITHLKGTFYSGDPSTDKWEKYGNEDYQYTLERIEDKFEYDYEYAQEVLEDVDEYILQLWSPKVSEGYLTEGLDDLEERFEDEYGVEIDMVINDEYKNRIDELRIHADGDVKDYGEPAFRFFQIIENI